VIDIGTGTLSVDNVDTFLLSYDLSDVDIGKQDKQVTIEGFLPTEPSEITIAVDPLTAVTGQNVTINGRIIPDRPNVDVKIEERSEMGGPVWRLITLVQTDENSQYIYNHTFDEIDNYKIKTSWAGDETYKSATSEIINITIGNPSMRVNIAFADGRDYPLMGDPNLPPPTKPETLNVTVTNATDLYSWKFKIEYDTKFVRIQDIWLPTDNVLEMTGLTYTFSFNTYEDYLYCEATINQTDQGYTGNGTLFQFNVTGFAGTFEFDTYLTMDPQSNIKNSEGSFIIFTHQTFYFTIDVAITATILVINPLTGESEFNFRSNETTVGHTFNTSIMVENATSIYGFSIELLFNGTLLNVTDVIQPINDPLYVFYNKNSTVNYDWENDPDGSVTLNDTAMDKAPFNGSGIIAFITFKIRMVTTNITLILETPLTVEDSEAHDGVDWRNTPNEGGYYTFIEIIEHVEQPPPTFLETYGLYLVILVIVAIIVYLVFRRLRPKQIRRRPARIVYRA
jgi:hypothetical protein